MDVTAVSLENQGGSHRRRRRRAIAAVVVLGLGLGTTTDAAADPAPDPAAQLDDVRDRRAAAEDKVDLAKEDADQLQERLRNLGLMLEGGRRRIDEARAALDAAVADHDLAVQQLEAAESRLEEANTQLGHAAIDMYTAQSSGSDVLAVVIPVNDLGIAEAMLGARTDDRLRIAQEVERRKAEVERRAEEAESRREQAERQANEIQASVSALEELRTSLQAVLDELDDRISGALAEAGALADIDARLSAQIAAEQRQRAEQAEAARRQLEASRSPADLEDDLATALGGSRRPGSANSTAKSGNAKPATARGGTAARGTTRNATSTTPAPTTTTPRRTPAPTTTAPTTAPRPAPTTAPRPAPTTAPTTAPRPAPTTTAPSAPTTPPPRVSLPNLATWADVRQVPGTSIWVRASIVDNVTALVQAARAAGINLNGGGFRDSNFQITLRKAACGTSDYEIYQKPARECRPPTAPPGRSQHELGLAVDFTVGGALVTSRTSPAFQWLAANAGRYGLRNLPSEPWHWSTTGN